ncbi:MAG: hypothetical protein WC455_16095 [Dehalococcoidia bacterium]|jgi:hypothetical protein
MSKQIIVESCLKCSAGGRPCPYSHDILAEKGGRVKKCWAAHEKIIDDPHHIPAWCPL